MHGGTPVFERTRYEFMQSDLSESNGAAGVSINQMELHLRIQHRYLCGRQICHRHRHRHRRAREIQQKR